MKYNHPRIFIILSGKDTRLVPLKRKNKITGLIYISNRNVDKTL